MADFSHHDSCPKCHSKDNLAVYSDGGAHCFGFGCGYHKNGSEESKGARRLAAGSLIQGEFEALRKRCIDEDTCRKFKYMVGEHRGDRVQLATYCDMSGKPVAQKVRKAGKEFFWVGDPGEAGLFGQHLWNKGRKIVVTEGEIDALSVSMVQQNKWPVVSVPDGAPSARKAIAKQLDWLEQNFDEVILMFDGDEPGQEAAAECAQLFTPGKCKVAKLPFKDPNECLQQGQGSEIVSAIWNAAAVRPEGLVEGADLWEQVVAVEGMSPVTYPWECLNTKLYGLRTSEIVTVTAGSGIGKSQIAREIEYHLLTTTGDKLGIVALEESVKTSALHLCGLHLNKPIHLPDAREQITDAELRTAFESTVGSGRVILYDHFGSMDSDLLITKIRQMVKGYGVRWVVLDHISIVVSGIAEGDERRIIDNAMTKLRSLVQELDFGLILVSHLKRPQGQGHEEGARTSLSQLRGSAAIAQLSDIVVGAERNQQDEEGNENVTQLRVLKNRYCGRTGPSGWLEFDEKSGRMREVDGPETQMEEMPF